MNNNESFKVPYEESKDKKVKKEDRAFLYFRENSRGRLNIKFGPEKYTKDTEKLSHMLLTGAYYILTLMAQFAEGNEHIEEEMYNYYTLAFSAIINEAFPKIFDKLRAEQLNEELAIQRVEEGHEISEETIEKIEQTKEKIKERFTHNQATTINEHNLQLISELETVLSQHFEILKYFNKTLDGLDYSEENEKKRGAYTLAYNIISDKITEIKNNLVILYQNTEMKGTD